MFYNRQAAEFKLSKQRKYFYVLHLERLKLIHKKHWMHRPVGYESDIINTLC